MQRDSSGTRLINIRLAACLAATLVMSANATAQLCQAPVNESCAGAIVLTNGDLPYNITMPLGCVNDMIDKPYFDVFYQFDCTQTGDYQLDMCDSSGDTYLRIYSGACGWFGGEEFAVADDECPGSPPNADPMLTVPLEAGTTYWIELGTWRDVPPWAPPLNSPYTFTLQLITPPCDGDANSDGVVDVNDISYILFRLGAAAPDDEGADVNADGVVDVNDISYSLFRLGGCQ